MYILCAYSGEEGRWLQDEVMSGQVIQRTVRLVVDWLAAGSGQFTAC